MPPPPVPVKNTINEVEALARKMHGLDIGDVAYLGCYTRLVCLAPAAAQAWAPPKSRQVVNTPAPVHILPPTCSVSIPAPPVTTPTLPASIPASSQPVEPVTTEIKKEPAFRYESKANSPDAAKRLYETILGTTIPHLTISELLSISPELRKEAVEHSRSKALVATSSTPPLQIEHVTPLHEIHVTLNGTHSELVLLDEGPEIVIIRQDVWEKTNAPINQDVQMRMQTANGSSQEMAGCLEMLEIDVEGIKTWAHAYIVPEAPYCLLLGRPWQCLVCLSKTKDTDNVHVSVHDPRDPNNSQTIKTTPRPWAHPSLALITSMFSPITSFLSSSLTSSTDIYHTTLPTSSTNIHHPSSLTNSTNIYHTIPPIISSNTSSHSLSTTRLITPIPISRLVFSSFAEFLLQSYFDIDPVCRTFAYKKVVNKVKPVATTMPAHMRIIHRFPEDPLASLPLLSRTPPAFIPSTRLTQEQMNKLRVFKNEFLLPEEWKLTAHILMNNELVLAWDENASGTIISTHHYTHYRTYAMDSLPTSNSLRY
ncbi:uncharacterized protein F5891DRAFT_1187029 [Suillus fuscotomentosus]|uniref:Uncharacterized protein n=1 Tax=Suillus fuscotomentosus TaxID=1912939 RepID=A0AAD4E9D5_9AGAM|nr:uncharacterized protein F5891DRAFT_1187029 [Suillus fuscotomentosus]KAG1902002.1 hypothetical protein F5891DRAFT_1187029 [Suillus fuscotomentosus]